MSAIFKARVLQFTTDLMLNPSEKTALTKEVVKFLLQLHGRQRATVLRKKAFALGCAEETIHFKNQFLDVSSYLHQELWKDVRDRKETEDVLFCLAHLSRKELKAFDAIEHTDVDVTSFDLGQWVQDKIKHLRSKTYKLRFIKEYDPSFDTEDFVQELACEAVRVVNAYGRAKSKGNPKDSLQTQLEKYIEGSLNNKILSFIEYHTSGTRRRAVSTNENLYKQLKTAKKHLNLVKREHETFYAGVVRTRLSTLKWDTFVVRGKLTEYVTRETVVRKFPKEVQEGLGDISIVTRGALEKVLLQQPFDGPAVVKFERGLTLVQDNIKATEGDYLIKTLSLDPTTELGAEDLEISNVTPDSLEEQIWLDELNRKVKDHRDSEYIQLVLGDAEPKLEDDFVAWVNENQKTRNLQNFSTRYQLAEKFCTTKYQDWDLNGLKEKAEIKEMFQSGSEEEPFSRRA